MTNNSRYDLIFLNKRDTEVASDWVYYRLTSIGGTDRDPIEAVLVKWPNMSDIDSASDPRAATVWTPGMTGMASAYATMSDLMKGKWGLEHDQSILIGIIERSQ